MTTPPQTAVTQPAITPQDFIAKWRRTRGRESAGAQEWFIDLCRVVEHGTPAEVDPRQEWYAFERTVREASGRRGRADVYKQGYFAWEFKGLHRDLDAAYRQLLRYREASTTRPCWWSPTSASSASIPTSPTRFP